MLNHSLVTIIVNYNGLEVTRECLESILLNEPIPPFVIIVDNNSENSEQLLQLINEYPLLEIIRNNENFGFGKANNIGIDWAIANIDFDHLLLLNNDTVITENALSQLCKNFHRSSLGIATCRIMNQNQPELIWYGGADINYKIGWPKIVDMGEKASPEGALKSRYVQFASGCMMLFSKESILKIKGFDERMFMYVEDLELCVRCEKLGLKIWYDADVVIYHKIQGSFKGGESFKGLHPKNPYVGFQFYQRKKNQWITFSKHLKGWQFIRFVFFYNFRYCLILSKLIILSPKRFQVIKAHFRVVGFILFRRFRKTD